MKTKISIDFHICISAPLKQNIFAGKKLWSMSFILKPPEAHLKASQATTINYFRKKRSIVNVRLGSKYASAYNEA